MYHWRLKGSHYEMGQKTGRIFLKAGIKFPLEKLDGFQRKIGTVSGLVLKEFFPEAAEEIRGITDIVHADNELFTAWLMCIGCCLYNLDESWTAETRGCTTFAFSHGTEVYYGRNNDLAPFLHKGCKRILYSFLSVYCAAGSPDKTKFREDLCLKHNSGKRNFEV
ncbi:hypothetical protein [Treponema lecithinolyticum]|uniref:hypothetical protein n=1 Tax=Treponema lecithinolyticum TaxID=53418 RepID=UPI0028E219FD|nr:hypothetical protein [Treponema lecithinolyticum]